MPRPLPLQNRVTPMQEIVSNASRGMLMGNRGGMIHDPKTKTLSNRRWSSRRWICCVTDFKGRSREVMGAGYTELFFLDEVTALAAGHRPCYECRRKAARDFASAFRDGMGLAAPPGADALDQLLHADRLDGRMQRRFRERPDNLPDGTMIVAHSQPHLIYMDALWLWRPEGYERTELSSRSEPVEVLTPRCIVKCLASGYRPIVHPSARRQLITNAY